MRPRWLAWAAFYFGLPGYGFSRIHTDQATPVFPPTPPHSYLKIRFLFSYTDLVCWPRKYVEYQNAGGAGRVGETTGPSTSLRSGRDDNIHSTNFRDRTPARMPPKKFFSFPVFRRCCAASTSASRLVSPSRRKADSIFRSHNLGNY